MVGLQTYHRQFDHAAAVLGAKPPRTLVHVTLPLIRSSVVTAAIFAFMTSFDDLNIALFLTGGEQHTLPKQIWSAMVLQATPILGGGVYPSAHSHVCLRADGRGLAAARKPALTPGIQMP
jgi:ABC-type spermidine/putrescine transport system permease subunit II